MIVALTYTQKYKSFGAERRDRPRVRVKPSAKKGSRHAVTPERADQLRSYWRQVRSIAGMKSLTKLEKKRLLDELYVECYGGRK
jgi:hypothetical protein